MSTTIASLNALWLSRQTKKVGCQSKPNITVHTCLADADNVLIEHIKIERGQTKQLARTTIKSYG